MAGIIRVCAMSLAPIKPQPRAGAPTFVLPIQYPPDVHAAHLSWVRPHRLDSSRDAGPPRTLCRKSLFHYPLTAPRLRPRTRYRCTENPRSKGGIMPIVVAAAISPPCV